MAVNVSQKKCSVCMALKPAIAEYFHADKGKDDGRSSACKDCAKARSHKWYWDNLQRARLSAKKFSARNRSSVTARHKAWISANKSHVLEYFSRRRQEKRQYINAQLRDWAHRNKEKVTAWSRNSRARRAGAIGMHTSADVALLLREQKNECAACRCIFGKYHVDHVMPIALGGSNDKANLQLLCPMCNRSKGAKHPALWEGLTVMEARNGR